jgi:hypothetical protein
VAGRGAPGAQGPRGPPAHSGLMTSQVGLKIQGASTISTWPILLGRVGWVGAGVSVQRGEHRPTGQARRKPSSALDCPPSPIPHNTPPSPPSPPTPTLSPAGVVLEEGFDDEGSKLEVRVAQVKAAQVKHAHDLLAARLQRGDGLVQHVAAQALAVGNIKLAWGVGV